MHNQKTLYHDPVLLLNTKLKQYGYIKNIYNNPLSLLIHMFYSFGNGYEFVEQDGYTIISHSELIDDEKDSSKKPLLDSYNELTKTYNKLLDKQKEPYFEKLLIHLHLTDSQFTELINSVQMQIDDLKNRIDFSPTYVLDIQDLKNFNIDEKNIYWEHLTKIVSNYSLIKQIPDNLSPEWKEVLDILQDKMTTLDSKRVEEALKLKDYEK